MKRTTLILILVIEAALLTALILLTKQLPSLFSSIAAFPFEQIADGLGAAAKSGRIGNGIAAALWIGFSAIPAFMALKTPKGRDTRWERTALFILSGVLLFALYGMINPGAFRAKIGQGYAGNTEIIKAAFGICIWAFIVLYLILRLIRLFRSGNKEQLLKYLRILLYVLCVLFTAAAVISLVNGILALSAVPDGAADKGLAVLRLIAGLIPYILDIIVILRVFDLLDCAKEEAQEGIAEAADRLSRICCFTLGITAALTAVTNIIQTAAMRRLTDIAVAVDLPIASIVFTVMILLFSRLLTENKRLRDDNSLFI